MNRDFSAKVRKAAKKASNNGKCWWVERFILNSYLWRGPEADNKHIKQFKERYNVKEKQQDDLQGVGEQDAELCELS